MKSEAPKKRKAVGRLWILADKRLVNGKVVSRDEDDDAVNSCLTSFNNAMTNLDELNAGYVDKPEVAMEARADNGKSFNFQALIV